MDPTEPVVLAGPETGPPSAEMYRWLFDAHPVPMAIWDPATGRILAANDAALAQYGYAADELVGLSVDALVHADDLPRLRERVPRLPDGFAGTELFRHVRKDGAVIEVEVSGHPIEFEGRAARLVLATDVTERRRLEEQLRQAQRMEAVGRLAGGIAHDFNNLLMAIIGFSDLLLERLPAGEEREAALEIRAAGERAAALTGQLIAFSRPRSSQPQTLDLNALVRDLEPNLRRVLGSNVELRVEAPAETAFVVADRAQLEQIVVSCAVNARDAMPDGGTVTIRTSMVSAAEARAMRGGIAEVTHVQLAVADTGLGMEPAIRDRAFDPFFTTKDVGAASGLGLAMVYAAVQAAGGRVRLESAPGRGSTVRIFLPLVETPAASHVAPTEAPKPGVAGTATILVAEDEPAVRAFIELVLRRAGHTVLSAADGTSALDIAAHHGKQIDLLLTDVVMPGSNGIEAARQMRRGQPNLRVLFMSGWASEVLRREGVDEDEIPLLSKPFSAAELLERVAAVLAGPARG